MIDRVDQQLEAWIRSKVGDIGDATVSFAAPAAAPATDEICAYLIGFEELPAPSTQRRAPLQVLLRYLVTATGDDPLKTHRWLGALLFAALDEPEYKVDFSAIPAELWTALRVPPRPAFVLTLPLRQPRPEPETKYVLKPLVVQGGPIRALEGALLSPDDFPIAGARIEYPALHLYDYTDSRGRFRFAGIPTGSPNYTFVVYAKGFEREFSFTSLPAPDAPLVIRFDPLEVRE